MQSNIMRCQNFGLKAFLGDPHLLLCSKAPSKEGFPDAFGSRLGISSARPVASSGCLVLQEWPRLLGLEKSATSEVKIDKQQIRVPNCPYTA